MPPCSHWPGLTSAWPGGYPGSLSSSGAGNAKVDSPAPHHQENYSSELTFLRGRGGEQRTQTWGCTLGPATNQPSLLAQKVKNPLEMQETRVGSLGQEHPLEKDMATHSGILAWRIPWTVEPGGLQSMAWQRATERLSLFPTSRAALWPAPIWASPVGRFPHL